MMEFIDLVGLICVYQLHYMAYLIREGWDASVMSKGRPAGIRGEGGGGGGGGGFGAVVSELTSLY